MIGNYNGIQPLLYTDKVVGGIKWAVGFKDVDEKGDYVPIILLEGDMRDKVREVYRIIETCRKGENKEILIDSNGNVWVQFKWRWYVMLVKISVENFKSFDQGTELNMISSSKIRTPASHRVKIKGTQLLRYGAVYGANTSGKTNLIEVFRFFKECVRKEIPWEAVQMFCKNREENKERESIFEMQITIGDKFYAYGFSVVLSRRKITGEWLYELHQSGTARCLFEREGSNCLKLGDSVTMTDEENNMQCHAVKMVKVGARWKGPFS